MLNTREVPYPNRSSSRLACYKSRCFAACITVVHTSSIVIWVLSISSASLAALTVLLHVLYLAHLVLRSAREGRAN